MHGHDASNDPVLRSHDHARSARPTALMKALLLTGSFLVVEVIGGLITGSLALLSDAAHMFTDTAALAITLAAVKIAERPADSRRTFGYQRFEILAASVNAILLFVVALYILYEGFHRFLEPPKIQSIGMLVVAVAGLIVNLLAMRILAAGQQDSVNIRGAYLEVWSDTLGSLGVIGAAMGLWLTGWSWIDTVVAIGIGLWVLPRAWSLLMETVNILLEGVPRGLDLESIAQTVRANPGVVDLHDLHVWALTSDQPSLSAHVVMQERADPDAVRASTGRALAEKFNILHVTLQIERVDCRTQTQHGQTH